MKKEEIIGSKLIRSYNDWVTSHCNRTYLTLTAAQPRYRGDSSTKIFIDNATKALVIEPGKGTTTRAFDEALGELKELAGC